MASFRAAPGRTSAEEFGRDACATLEVALASVSRPSDGAAHVSLQELTGRVAAHADGLKMAIAKMAVLWNTAEPLCPADTQALLQAMQDRVLGICAAFCSLTCAGHTLQVSVDICMWDCRQSSPHHREPMRACRAAYRQSPRRWWEVASPWYKPWLCSGVMAKTSPLWLREPSTAVTWQRLPL